MTSFKSKLGRIFYFTISRYIDMSQPWKSFTPFSNFKMKIIPFQSQYKRQFIGKNVQMEINLSLQRQHDNISAGKCVLNHIMFGVYLNNHESILLPFSNCLLAIKRGDVEEGKGKFNRKAVNCQYFWFQASHLYRRLKIN